MARSDKFKKSRAMEMDAPHLTCTTVKLPALSPQNSNLDLKPPTLSPLSEGSHFDLFAHRSSVRRLNKHSRAQDTKAVVHRCRFVDYTPGSITALACTPSTWDPSPHFGIPDVGEKSRGVLAVGRGNGNIEIWVWLADSIGPKLGKKKSGSSQGWVLYRTLPGHVPSESTSSSTKAESSSALASKIENLVFAHQTTEVDPDDEDEQDNEKSNELASALPRLFGSNGGEEVLEWEWDGSQAGIIKRTLPMPPSIAVWSLAVCPQSTTLAIGCDDGVIRLATIADDSLEFIRKLDPCKSRLLSVAWGVLDPPAKSDKTTGRNQVGMRNSNVFLVAGCADSGLRKWNVSTGRCVGRMTVDKLQGEPTLVWTVAVVGKFIVSGDSMGNINFWDSKTCARLQNIRAHRADILCLVVSPDGNDVFTSGIDQKTCQLTLTNKGQKGQPDFSKWIMSASRRLHSHDVRALAISPPYKIPTPVLDPSSSERVLPSPVEVPVLISGGLDMTLVLCPAASPTTSFFNPLTGSSEAPPNPISDSASLLFRDSIQRKVSYVTRRAPAVQLSTGGRLLVCRKDRSISIWQLRTSASSSLTSPLNSVSEPEENDDPWRQVVDMDLKFQTNVVSSAVSPDGRWLAVSDLYQTKLFTLQRTTDGNLQPRRVKNFAPFHTIKHLSQGASTMHFSPDSTRLVLATSFTSQVVVVGLDEDSKAKTRVLRVFNQHRTHLRTNQSDHRIVITPPNLSLTSPTQDTFDEDGGQTDDLTPSGNTITAIAISSDCQWLASVDSKQVLHVFNLDLLKHHCILPTPPLIVNCLSFSPTTPSTLVIGFANNTLQVMNVEDRKIPEWAQQVCANPPYNLTQLRDPIMGISFDSHVDKDERSINGCNSSISSDTKSHLPHVFLLWGATWTAKVTLPDHPNGTTSSRQKRPRRLVDLLATGEDENQPDTGTVTPSDVASVKSNTEPVVQHFVQVSHKYQPILLLDFMGQDEMVIVERPFFGLLAHLPPAWSRTGAYGT
ncbi:quinon protein alcohol dehydrogenase-like superfamily [Melampsora americana]|nr:quinon protein alcohol dehydrogenase-like superfamily [Melampsora americana]